MLVVHGDNASGLEQRTARRIAERTRLHGGWGYNLLSETEALADEIRLAQSDLIIVGHPGSSELVRQHWSHWAWMPGIEGRRPSYFAQPGTRFFLFGVGSFQTAPVGYVYCDRNPFNRYADTESRRQNAPPPPHRIMVMVTGTDSQAVKEAADAFLGTGLLNGVIPSHGVVNAHTPFEVPLAKLPRSLPAWFVPTDDGPVRWSGWHQANALDYAGFKEVTGVSAMAMWRVQYDLPPNPAHDSPRWHRQDSGFEVLAAELASPDAAADASAALREALGLDWRPIAGEGGTAWSKSMPAGPFHVWRHGRYVLMETLPAPQDARILGSIVMQIPPEGAIEPTREPRMIRPKPGGSSGDDNHRKLP